MNLPYSMPETGSRLEVFIGSNKQNQIAIQVKQEALAAGTGISHSTWFKTSLVSKTHMWKKALIKWNPNRMAERFSVKI